MPKATKKPTKKRPAAKKPGTKKTATKKQRKQDTRLHVTLTVDDEPVFKGCVGMQDAVPLDSIGGIIPIVTSGLFFLIKGLLSGAAPVALVGKVVQFTDKQAKKAKPRKAGAMRNDRTQITRGGG